MADSELSIRQVEAFRALMQVRTVTRAAHTLGVSQPAVSRLLADFESSVGFALFERRQGRLWPTAQAHALLAEVERAFSGFDRVVQAAAQIREQRRGAICVAATPEFAADFLPRVAAAFAHEHEGVDVALLTLEPALALERVAARRCDLAIVNEAAPLPGVRLERLGQWPMRGIVPRGHRLARKRVLGAADCEGEAFVSFAPGTPARLRIDRLFAECAVTRASGVEADLAQAVVTLVEAGMGIALVDPVTAAALGTRVAVKRFEPALEVPVNVARAAQHEASPLADAFARYAAAALARLR
ncbi:LysR family transcriptional regulator [Paraburkholderia eburnea]|uniref:LysR family transcriptional regulator n=1 Tax=Paraburkholderia eburnea TaxID=1189126 RepID=A0A2S4MC52_9BURK|nr:LysR substrate-binding domain-containing protein [Paraburkholderia eburnea]POR52316.1 LysR family transcriptional regulator [Paraburkholderia eburnea]PRZ23207.1 LysR family transcriptional regulator [Paraburkholderia eburnea]